MTTLYNKTVIDKLTSFVHNNHGIADKEKLSLLVQREFKLTKDRKVFYCEDFAIRFSRSENKRMSNTVLSLPALQKYDSKPFFVCIVASTQNHLLLANTTFLKKISHSSKELRVDNIRGSFNGSDIQMEFEGIENNPSNFQSLFAYHDGFTFQDNLERLVESTNNIAGRIPKFDVTNSAKAEILNSIQRATSFISSEDYRDLKADLNERVKKVQGEIAIAAFIDNVNVRGRIIEHLITDSGSTLKDQIIKALRKKQPLPSFKTEDKLGDYSKKYPTYNIETDIKTKVLFLDGNPKAYNIDKLLEFLASEQSVYMIYLLGINDDGSIVARLCSVFDSRLMRNTKVIHHWAGRNTRGVAQFIGTGLVDILNQQDKTEVDEEAAKDFLDDLIFR